MAILNFKITYIFLYLAVNIFALIYSKKITTTCVAMKIQTFTSKLRVAILVWAVVFGRKKDPISSDKENSCALKTTSKWEVMKFLKLPKL